MIDIQCLSESQRNYMKLSDPDWLDPDTYQVRILLSQSVPGLLPCSLRVVDNVATLFYDITGLRSVQEYYDMMVLSRAELERIVTEVLDMVERSSAFLLDVAGILLDVRHLYLDPETGALCFGYLHRKEQAFTDNFREFIRYLLCKTDTTDPEAVMLACQLFQLSWEDAVDFEAVRRVLYLREKTTPADERRKESTQEQRDLMDSFFSEDPAKEEPKSSFSPVLIGAAAVGVFAAVATIFFAMRLLFPDGGPGVAGVILLILSAAALAGIWLVHRSQKKEDEEIAHEFERWYNKS